MIEMEEPMDKAEMEKRWNELRPHLAESWLAALILEGGRWTPEGAASIWEPAERELFEASPKAYAKWTGGRTPGQEFGRARVDLVDQLGAMQKAYGAKVLQGVLRDWLG